MSQRGRGGGRQQFQPRNEQERHQFMLCREVGLPYPPQPQQICIYHISLKNNAELALKNNDLEGSASMYTMALRVVDLFPWLPQFVGEHHKLLCNRSLVLLKMRRFKDAERDAQAAIVACPSFLKGYWRASQAIKGGYNGTQKALPYLVEAFRRAMNGEGDQHDIVTFLTEICILVPSAPDNEVMDTLLNTELELPYGEQYVEIWSKVIQNLAAKNHWKSLAILLTGWHEGVFWDVHAFSCTTWTYSSIDLGKMFKCLTDSQIQNWGEDLAVYFIENGTPIDEIGKPFGMPSLHYVVKICLKIDLCLLLESILGKYSEETEKLNAQDKSGSTALHILVQSPRANSQHAVKVLRLLLDANCDASIVDSKNMRPIDYVRKGNMLYAPLSMAIKSVDDLRKELEAFKSQGNSALKAGRHTEALSFYEKALMISQQSKKLYKEAAIVYSNRANVYFSLKNNTEALTNALAAISCDSEYHKGHWWKAKVLYRMGSSQDSFNAYMEGFKKSVVSQDVKNNFLIEAVQHLKNIPNEHFNQFYHQLWFLNREIWPQILAKLSKLAEWKGIAYLILGPNLDKKRFGQKVNAEDIEELCSGVAGKSSFEDIQANTVFQFMNNCNPVKEGPWLDAVVYACVYCHGNQKTSINFAVGDGDSPEHAQIRFALRIERLTLVEDLPDGDHNFSNSAGDSVFHCITKLRPPPAVDILYKCTKLLMEKGYSVMKRDASGKLAVEYLDNKYPGYVFNIFFQETKSYTIEDINRLKVEGNEKFKKGDIIEAIELYSKAIDIFQNGRIKMVQFKLTNHEIAVLFGNRSECYLKLNMFKEALDDAMQSNAYDGHWHKAHIRIGKAYKGLRKIESARKAFTNAFQNIDPREEDKVKVEVLTELALVCSRLPKNSLNIKKRLPDMPAGQGLVWAQAFYDLVRRGEWDSATIAHSQYFAENPKRPHLTWSLRPFCDLSKLKEYSWGMEMLKYLLECGCNRRTITVETGDTYLHAVVRMTLVSAKNTSLLQYIMRQYCRPNDPDQHKVDGNQNTVLHIATMEQRVDRIRRYDVIVMLLKAEVDPNKKNRTKHLAIDYLHKDEQDSRSVLRMVMHDKENISMLQTQQQKSRDQQSRDQPLSTVNQSNNRNLNSQVKRTCDICDDLFSQGVIKLSDGELSDGYEKMAEILKQKHKGDRHDQVVRKAVSEMVKKLGATFNPEIPKCLMSIGSENYLLIVNGLANGNKWRQLDMLIRKFRQMHGSDQLKCFASTLTIVPVVRDTSLAVAEELKLQIITNLLNSGGSLGSDNGQTAVRYAVTTEHYKVLTELVKRGADTTNLSVYDGDTPIHAALTIALEKDKSLVLLEYLMDQFDNEPKTFPYLDPEQLDENGDCLFHLVARPKFSSIVLKLTEMLCKRNVCANYFNKDGKRPIDCITKKNDRRKQYFRLAGAVKPSREQIFGRQQGKKENKIAGIAMDEDLHQLIRPADREVNLHPVAEVVRPVSVKEKRKKHIEEMISHFPDSKHSIFKVESSTNVYVDTGYGGGKGKIETVNMTLENIDSNDNRITGVSKGDISGTKIDMPDLKNDSSGLKNDISGFKSDIPESEDGNSGFKSDIPRSKSYIPDLKSDKSDLKSDSTDDEVEPSERNTLISQNIVSDMSSGLEHMTKKLGSVVRKTLEDVAATLSNKAKHNDDDNEIISECFEYDLGTNIEELMASSPPSLEKEIEGSTLNSSCSSHGESTEEFVDAQETQGEHVSNDLIYRHVEEDGINKEIRDIAKKEEERQQGKDNVCELSTGGNNGNDYIMTMLYERNWTDNSVSDTETSKENKIEGTVIDIERNVNSNNSYEIFLPGEDSENVIGFTEEEFKDSIDSVTANMHVGTDSNGTFEKAETMKMKENKEHVECKPEFKKEDMKNQRILDNNKDRKDVETSDNDDNGQAKKTIDDSDDFGIQNAVDDSEQVNVESDDNDDIVEEEFEEIDVQVFDNLEWEVECTAEVWKTLRDKHVLPEMKRRIVRKVQLLASGDWQPHLRKKLQNVPKSLNLFEAKFSKGCRIIWELAIAFSPRCSETAERRLQSSSGEVGQPVRGGRIYSEIIRVWDIVLDHDKIHRCVQRIKKSHQRGETCIIQKKLRGIRESIFQMPVETGKRYPILYAENEITEDELEEHHQEMQNFFPPASSNDTEYHILKFYSFSSTLVSHVLQNIETKVDFPFRVTDLEHAIINLQSKAPILLLGRSGTGKTTCCLYRLWSQFQSYWYKAKEADAPLLPRCVEFIHQEADEIENENVESEEEEDEVNETEGATGTDTSAKLNISDQGAVAQNLVQTQYDHIHQLFITKNAVLSNEVQKNFRELSHADDLLREHVEHEEEVLPSRFQDVQDFAFPLFLTSRQLLLMLDASIGPPYFFERKDDGSLKVDITGWTDIDGPLSFLPMLNEDFDAEDEVEQYKDDDDLVGAGGQDAADRKLKLDPRREITYGVFIEEVWPKIKKTDGNYHPSLVWMEIMSFIKGSYEALSKPWGYLTKDEYTKLGRKRASNFSGERDSIYSLFKRYEHFKKQNSLFDETDLIHDTFRRLRQLEVCPWVIHQIFVDETQDFTQAELCMLIRLCQNPNDMFLTGDTAQSIMRGISFRFSDLRSLFYHAKKSMVAMGKTSAVEVPKQVYQLTHNYRSHAGILSLATSVLELMIEFFPESFDRLNPDQGLFHGPQPILLESCSFSDLAVLLRGNRRKTSHIEFGAHQAILVVNNASRESIPEELRLGLVLTIYEAKGLEFDDVLLYNFFKDSQANKEWRVVTDFLERLASEQKEKQTPRHENLVQIDYDILTEMGRPRPLDFDPNQHKVLNSELKHLYTALTRARVNVWIFDEEKEKRAPMFEYFKVRKLVKSMHVEEINETSLSETVFAEKSSPADWIRRGEDFMRHSLYVVAAKCFGMGGDHEKEKVALAHGQALQASRMKENPRQMREEFLHAAELYMECGKPAKAAICLQNAKERELAAGLFEKLGQYERAAEIYSKLKRPMSSSRCYEQLGNYNKAVEVLNKNEHFDLAIDTLKRYEMMIEELKQNKRPIPPQLLTHKPKAQFTEEKLSHSAANLFHKYKNEEKMLEAVDRFQTFRDKVDFLKSRNYISQAAKILEENNRLEEAAQLLLMYGRFEEANTMAKKTLKEEVIAHCLHVTCRVQWSKKRKNQLPLDYFEQILKDALIMSQSCNDNDQYGQMSLLQAEIFGNVKSVELGWKAFKDSKPYQNDAGLVECADWLVRNGDLQNHEVLQSCVRGIEHLFIVCRVLLNPDTQTNLEHVQKYDKFYGLSTFTQDKVVIHTKEKPLCLNIIQMDSKGKSELKKIELEVLKTDVHESIVMWLLNRSKLWLEKLGNALKLLRDKNKVCEYFQAGLVCPHQDNMDESCRYLHFVQTQATFKKLIKMDMLMIEYEENIHDGALALSKNCPSSVKLLLQGYISDSDVHPDIKFQVCLQLWNDLMPAGGHSLLVGDDSKLLIEYIRQEEKVVQHFKRFLLEKWKMFTAGEKKLKSPAARQTEVYLLFEFGYHLFGLDTGKRKLQHSPIEEMRLLESTLDKEVAMKPKILHSQKFFTLMIDVLEDRYLSVTCIAHRFTEAFLFISTKSDPFEAVMKFSKFQIQLSNRDTHDFEFYPDMKTYMMWLEFYSCLAIFLISKLKTENFPDFVFVLPSNYFALIQFIQATFPSSGRSVYDSIGWWVPSNKMKILNHVQQRLKGFAFVVSGHAQRIRILDKILQMCHKDPRAYVLLERLIILNMVMVSNIGKSVSPETEMSLMSSLTRISLPSNAPERLKGVFHLLKSCEGIASVVTVLINLFAERKLGEELIVCKWRLEKKATIEKTTLQNVSLFETSFLNEKTIQCMHQRVYVEQTSIETPLDAEINEEEIEKAREEKNAQLMKEKYHSAVIYVQLMFRAKQEARRLRKMKEESKTQMDVLFEHIKVDESMCGYCGVHFVNKLEDRLQFEKSAFVGGTSKLNEIKSPWGNPATRQNSGEQLSWKSDDQESTERRKVQLSKIRDEHVEEQGHIQKKTEMTSFIKKYNAQISPGLRKINDFLNSDEYGLNNNSYVEKNYAQEELAINRMKRKAKRTEIDIQMLLTSRMWSTTAAYIEQNMLDLETDFKTVEPYVKEIYKNLKQKEEERKRQNIITTNDVAQSCEIWDDDDRGEEIEKVVEVPQPIRQREFRNKKRYPNRRNQRQ